MTRGFLGSGIAAIIETALSPLDPNGRIPIRVKIVCTSGGNRLLRTPFIAIRMERLAEETDKVSVERLWKHFQRSGTIKSIESLLLSFFFFFSLSFSPIARSLSEWKVERGFATVCFTSNETK